MPAQSIQKLFETDSFDKLAMTRIALGADFARRQPQDTKKD